MKSAPATGTTAAWTPAFDSGARFSAVNANNWIQSASPAGASAARGPQPWRVHRGQHVRREINTTRTTSRHPSDQADFGNQRRCVPDLTTVNSRSPFRCNRTPRRPAGRVHIVHTFIRDLVVAWSPRLHVYNLQNITVRSAANITMCTPHHSPPSSPRHLEPAGPRNAARRTLAHRQLEYTCAAPT